MQEERVSGLASFSEGSLFEYSRWGKCQRGLMVYGTKHHAQDIISISVCVCGVVYTHNTVESCSRQKNGPLRMSTS
jgi:hypothetical protein